MAVYIDALIKWGGSATFKWKESCHMFADTPEELHAMAKKIGLKREWFQDHSRLPHYDLNKKRRVAAIKAGCIEADRKKTVSMMKKYSQ